MSKRTVKERILGVKGSNALSKDYSLVQNFYELGMELRRPFEQRWLIGMAFYSGRQYTFFNSSAWLLQQLKSVKGRIRNVDNQLLPRVRRQISDAILNPPTLSVAPNSHDDEDIKAAKVGDKVLKSWWQNNKMKKKIRQLHTWKYVTGNAFLDDRWNPKLGPLEKDKRTGELIYLGDADAGVWSPFEVLVPYAALGDAELEGFPWMMKLKWRQLDTIATDFKNGKDVPAEDLPKQQFDATHLFGLMSGTGGLKAKGALIKELYIKPNQTYPKGLHIIAANGIILQKDTYAFKDYNLAHFKDIDLPGIFWGQATLDLGIPLQRTWNRTISGVDEFNRVMGKGKWLVPRGSNLEAMPDDTHGEALLYTPQLGLKPEMMTMKSLPKTYELALGTTQRSLQDLFSQQEVTKGTNKSDIRSGDMVELLLEQNARGNVPTFSSDEESYQEFGGRILGRIAKGYEAERMLKITGQEGEFDIFAFKGADLKNNTDVIIRSDTMLPESRIARNAIVERRFEKGFYGDPADPEVRRNVANMLKDAITENIYEDTRLDEANARNENLLMTEGGLDNLLPNQYDNHFLHKKEHDHYRKSRDYQKLKVEQPREFLVIDVRHTQHSQSHQAFIQEIIQAQQEAAANAK